MPTDPVTARPGVHPDDGADAADRGAPGVDGGRPPALVVGAGLVVAVLVGALGGPLVVGRAVPGGTTLLAVAALALVPAVLVARSVRRVPARAAAVAGCALLAVALHPVLGALTAAPGAVERAGGHAAHHGAPAVDPPAAARAAGVADPGGPGRERRTWAESVAAVDLAALRASGVDLRAVRDAGYDLAALAAAGLDATTLAAAGADPADEHAPHHVAAAVAAAADDAVTGAVDTAPARDGDPVVAVDDVPAPGGGTADALDAAAGHAPVDVAPARALAVRLAAAAVTALLAGVVLRRGRHASHPTGGSRARVVTS